jgi:acyl carrier protein/SAM-dependent methyltransferase
MQHLLEESKLEMRNMGYETPNQTSLMPPLVMRSNTPNLQPGLSEFVVNTQNPRYKKVVGGHVVCSQPLCPAPLYMELATLALQQLLFVEKGDSSQGSTLKEKGLSFEDLRVNSPLGMDPPGTVFIQLQEIPERKQTWKMTVSVVGPSGAKTVNVDAIIALITNTILEGFQRLVSRSIESLLRSDQTEKLQCSRAYKLFERVVKYDHFYMAMQSIEMKEHEAVATVELPKDQPHREENEAWQSCDAVLLDACIHVCGLLINTSSSICSEDVAVMVGLDRAVLSPSFGTLLTSQLTVLASFNTTDQQQHPIGDVFVCTPQGELVAMFTGCHMTCLPVTRLEKIIGAASKPTKGGKWEAKSTQAGQMSSSMPALSARSEKDGSRSEMQLPNAIVGQGSSRHGASALKKLVSECTLIETSNIPEDTALELIGLDSLGAAELSEELSGQLNLNIDPVSLLKSTILDLQKLMGDDNDEDPIQASPNINNYRENAGEILGNESQTERREMSLKVLLHVLHETSGAGVDNIEPRNTLTELGIDSLSKIDLKEEIETHFMVQIELNSETTVGEIMKQLKLLPEPDELFNHTASKQNFGQASIDSESVSTSTIKTNPLETLSSLVTRFDGIAASNGVANYWSDIAPFQDELALAYIIEGFASLGVDLRSIPSGQQVPLLPYISPKYDKLVRRLWEILERSGLVTISNAGPEGMPLSAGTITRSSRIAEVRPASQLLEEFGHKFTFFHDETRLIGLTGPQLANCLSGKTDSVALMFGNSNALKIMEDYYGNSPISATLTEQLCVFLTTLLLQDPIVGSRRPVRILEVGGGTGGTTKHLAEALEKAGISTEYTFTDISSSLVKKAKGKLERKYPWISYATLNLEDEVRPDLLGQFDIALATNTVHATTDRIASCRRLRETLKHGGGLLVLAELTCHIDWCDICFGLLDGWWLADGPIAPLQTAEEWMSTYSRAGFTSMAYSSSSNPRTNTAQLLVACNARWESSKNCVPMTVVNGFGGNKSDKEKPGRGNYRLDTAVYKEIDGVQIHADIYYPKEPLPEVMPIGMSSA